MSTITASIQVQFQSAGADGALVAEIDSREDGLNRGDTEFRPGDPVYYLVYKTSNVSILQHLVTAGAIGNAGGGSHLVEEYLTFSDSREASLKLPVAGGFSATWLGRSPGHLSLASPTKVVIPGKGVGIARVTYTAAYTAYVLTNVPITVDLVMIFLQGQAA